MLPKFARSKKQELAVWNDDSELTAAQMLFLEPKAKTIAEEIRTAREIPLHQLYKRYPGTSEIVSQLEDTGMIQITEGFAQQGSSRTETIYESCIDAEELGEAKEKLGRAVKQWEVLRYLTYQGAADGKTLRSYWNNYLPLVKALEQKKFIVSKKVQVQRYHTDDTVFRNEQQLVLNDEQQHALDTILALADAPDMQWALLHGVTGSGKTEVYLRTLRHVLDQGKGAMVLVPEISLTPQLIGRFRAVLGEYVEVLHSNLSDGERFDAWQRLRAGETRVVIGVRSAVFAPVQNLGLIIMDEEHESTFKQSEPDPRYHAREAAKHRMEQNHGLLLLGSATPSVETYYHAQHHGGTIITMKNRAKQQPLPKVEIVNMAREFQTGNRSMFSQRLAQAIEDSLQKGEQVILFLNRRGFSSSILCRECGHTLTCEKCSIALTYHREQQLAKCHYCDYMQPVPAKCPKCGSRFIRYMGSGTELVEEEVKKRWPWIRTERMDLDTTQNKNAHQEIL
ncbi:MAG: primosomal protein N', partial [Peptococcaceae bacterium]|nr:primosomal protein N' [Peptococcaceae bacterium]